MRKLRPPGGPQSRTPEGAVSLGVRTGSWCRSLCTQTPPNTCPFLTTSEAQAAPSSHCDYILGLAGPPPNLTLTGGSLSPPRLSVDLSFRAAKQRRKGDRLVAACEEQTYRLVNRPPPGVRNVLEQGPERGSCTAGRVQTPKSPLTALAPQIEFSRKALGRTRVKSSICLEAVAVPTKLRVERWGFSFRELLDDPVGRTHFMDFLQKEFSAENLSFWEVREELRCGGQAQVPALVHAVYQQFLAPGAARWVNIDSRTMERTLEGLRQPHCYVLHDAQLHIYTLMKKSSHLCGSLGIQAPAQLFVPPLGNLQPPAVLQMPFPCRRKYGLHLRSLKAWSPRKLHGRQTPVELSERLRTVLLKL
ncbi:Regulator of G-protein signaling 11 [Fukomys damarensis]|uniref:Regulator of G-protein signaling 11 n=1 Tax=Fukomys damarensis TaxID=885580 RepID=A0A091DWH7_FUKDA|nr:Regulator of G-protein signaling 11 [Fukomys damarensis]